MENPTPRKVSTSPAAAWRAALPVSLCLALAPAPRAQGAYKGPAWTAKDSSSAADFLKALRAKPSAVDSLTSGPGNFSQEKDLGFGYRLKEVWVNPAGKLGFTLKVMRHGREPVAFEVNPVMNYAALAPRYQAVLKGSFAPAKPGDPNSTAAGRPDQGLPAYLPYHWNLAEACHPLPADSLGLPDAPPSPALKDALCYYMSPYSGTTYGIRGGRGGQLLENRDRFLGLGDSLMLRKDRALWMLRSPNPASRLTAAEFVIRHKAAFPDYEQLLAGPLKKVFANPAKAETMRGDATLKEDARKLAFEFSTQEVKRSGRGVFRQ
jgi:hypothetical protein